MSRDPMQKPSALYAELHCITNFTFLRGASHPLELVEQACALGYTALAITDEHEAANHFNLLTFVNVVSKSFYGAIPVAESEIEDLVTAGVWAFLRLYHGSG